MSKEHIYNYYFGSDIFNIQPISTLAMTNSNKPSFHKEKLPNMTITSYCDTNKARPHITNHSKTIETTNEAQSRPNEHFLKYDPEYYWNKSPFVKEHNERVQKLKSLPKKDRTIEYNASTVKFRKYGSSIGLNDYLHIDTQPKRDRKHRSITMNNSVSYLGEDINKTPVEISVRMNQSNIFNLEQKEHENSLILHERIERSKTPVKCLTQESLKDAIAKADHPKFKPKIDKTISKGNEIQIIKDFFKQQTQGNVQRHINNASTLYDKDYYHHMYSRKHKMTDGVIHKFEINKEGNDYCAIDTKAIKQEFRRKGINVFGTENHDCFSYGQQKCIIKIRTNENDGKQLADMKELICRIERVNKVNFSQIKEKSRTSIGKSLSLSNSCKSIKDIVNPKETKHPSYHPPK